MIFYEINCTWNISVVIQQSVRNTPCIIKDILFSHATFEDITSVFSFSCRDQSETKYTVISRWLNWQKDSWGCIYIYNSYRLVLDNPLHLLYDLLSAWSSRDKVKCEEARRGAEKYFLQINDQNVCSLLKFVLSLSRVFYLQIFDPSLSMQEVDLM